MKFKITPKAVEVNWGDYNHLQGCKFSNKYLEDLGCSQEEFVDGLKAQGLTEDVRKTKKLKPTTGYYG
jgi:hypothetical protein